MSCQGVANQGAASSAFSTTDLHEINKKLKELRSAQSAFIESQCVLYSFKDLSRTSDLPKRLIDKMHTILIQADIEKGRYSSLFDKSDLTVIQSFNDAREFTKLEKISVKENVEAALSKKVAQYQGKALLYQKCPMIKSFTDGVILSKSKREILANYELFNKEFNKYNSLLKKYDDLMDKVLECKCNMSAKNINSQFSYLKISAEEIYLKTRLQNLEKKRLILSVNKNTFEDLCQLQNSLDLREIEIQDELKKLQSEVDKYESLADTEFPSLVKEYERFKKQYSYLKSTLNDLPASNDPS